jgi:hypothetical protein
MARRFQSRLNNWVLFTLLFWICFEIYFTYIRPPRVITTPSRCICPPPAATTPETTAPPPSNLSLEPVQAPKLRCSSCACYVEYAIELQKWWKLRPNLSAAPLVHTANYVSLGFSRLIQNTRSGVLIATLLGRPYVMDLANRSNHQIWRTFFEPGELDWRVPFHMRQQVHAYRKALKSMESAIVDSPLPAGVEWLNINRTRDPASLASLRSSGERRNTTLYIANWAPLEFNDFFSRELEQASCNNKGFSAELERSMYASTDLSDHLVSETLKADLGQENATIYDSAHAPYGAVHLRSQFMNLLPDAMNDFAQAMTDCASSFPKIRKWIVVSDTANVTMALVPKLPQVLVHHYSQNASGMGNQLTAVELQRAAIDWWVLAHAAVTIFSGSPFGETAAEYQRKIRESVCGDGAWVFFVAIHREL